jgi:SAM-dependent methyltransferase
MTGPTKLPEAPRVSGHYHGDRGAAYWRAYAATWDAVGGSYARLFAPYVNPTDALVDFGCGTGDLLALLEARSKVGVEVSDVSRARAAGRGLSVVPRSEDLERDSADVVVSNHALEHTLQPYLELRALHRVLRPGGTLVLCLPIDDWRVQRRPRTPDRDNHLYGWTPRLLNNLLVEAGFSVRETRVVTRGHPGRLTPALGRLLPPPLFEAMAFGTAIVLRRRQMIAVATTPPA